MPLVACQQFLLSILDTSRDAVPTSRRPRRTSPPDPRIQAKVPPCYVRPSATVLRADSSELGGTVPRSTGPGTARRRQGTPAPVRRVRDLVRLHGGTQQDPKFPAIVDTVMMALRYSQPNPYEATDPATSLTSSIYNVGEQIRYRTGVEATNDERWLRYDALLTVTVWELIRA